ncbi:MAG: globin [Pseudomonadales bacterium]|nr:globin [Pseudomonadales bacterium]
MQTAAIIINSMERVAQRSGDITQAVFANYLARCEGSRGLMSHMDQHMQGRMLEQVLLLLMEDGEEELQRYLAFETANHASYGVEYYMYENLFAAVQDVVYASLSEDLTAAEKAAWQSRVQSLLRAVESATRRLAAPAAKAIQ